MKKLGIAGLAVAGLLATSTVASAQVFCALGLIVMGIHTYSTENRELTQKEAMTCGVIRETPEPKATTKTRRTKKKQ